MGIELKIIPVHDYNLEKEKLFSLLGKIWTRAESFENVKHSLERWGNSKSETGEYFYIMQDGVEVGITGYFIPDIESGTFGLRHHGTSVRGTGKIALGLLITHLKEEYDSFAKQLVELIPEGKENLMEVFTSWGFELTNVGVPDWEPKKNYYKYVMVRKL